MAILDGDTVRIREGSKEFSDQVVAIDDSIKNIRSILLDLKTVSSGADFDKYIECVCQDKEFEPYENIVSTLNKIALAFSSVEEDSKSAINNSRRN